MTPRDPDRGDVLTLEEAAAELGVHYMTVYRYVRLGRLPAEQVAGRWQVERRDLSRLRAKPASRRGRKGPDSRWDEVRHRSIQTMLAGDTPATWAIVEECLTRGAGPGDIYLELLAPALRSIGDMWASGSATVQTEHRASAVATRVVGLLGPRFSRRGPPRRGTVVIGGAPGDSHQLPVTIVSDLLRLGGMRVMDLGGNVPASAFEEAITTTPELRAVGISLSVDGLRAATAEAIGTIRRVRPGVPVLVGGPVLTSAADAVSLGADLWAPDAPGALRLLESTVLDR